MQIAYAVVFFLLVGVCEALRNGIFGFEPAVTPLITHCALLTGAIVLLRSDAIFLAIKPKHTLYGREDLGWSWSRSLSGVVLAPVIFCLPVAYDAMVSGVDVDLSAAGALQPAVFQYTLLMIICQSLFFGEAVVCAFGRDKLQAIIISGLSIFIFYMPDGIPQALIAVGSGIYYLTLRLNGTNMLIAALLHGCTIIAFGTVISLGLSQDQLWSYSVYYICGAAVLSLLVHAIFARSPREKQYA